jgi:mycoredoxin
MLEQAEAEFEYIDVYLSAEAKERLREINHGYQSVPTLVFPDGSTLTEPSMRELRAKLETLGYQIQPLTWLDQLQLILESPTTRLFGIISLVLGFTGSNNSLIAVGVVLLLLGLLTTWLNR